MWSLSVASVGQAADWLTGALDDLLARLGVDRRDVGDQIAAWLRDQPPPAGPDGAA